MKFLKAIVFWVMLLSAFCAAAVDYDFKFNSSLPVSKSLVNPGCHVDLSGYSFDATMMGWSSPVTTCTAANLLSNPGYLTAGQYGPGVGALIIVDAPQGVSFLPHSLILKNYSLRNNTYIDVIDDAGSVTSVFTKGFVGAKVIALPAIQNAIELRVRSTNYRIDITDLIVSDSQI